MELSFDCWQTLMLITPSRFGLDYPFVTEALVGQLQELR
jgi:hypothetical protein